MKFTIDRTKWLRGEGSSMLLDPTTREMCCVGFYALACGLSESDISGLRSPSAIEQPPMWPDMSKFSIEDHRRKATLRIIGTRLPECMAWLVATVMSQTYASGDGRSIMQANDSKGVDEASRESSVRDIFERNGVEVRFVN